jgi:hypothetical protein
LAAYLLVLGQQHRDRNDLQAQVLHTAVEMVRGSLAAVEASHSRLAEVVLHSLIEVVLHKVLLRIHLVEVEEVLHNVEEELHTALVVVLHSPEGEPHTVAAVVALRTVAGDVVVRRVRVGHHSRAAVVAEGSLGEDRSPEVAADKDTTCLSQIEGMAKWMELPSCTF